MRARFRGRYMLGALALVAAIVVLVGQVADGGTHRTVATGRSVRRSGADPPRGPTRTPVSRRVAATPEKRRSLVPTATSPAAGRPRTGAVTYPLAVVRGIQRAVDGREPGYLYYLDPVRVTLHDLPRYGFTGSPISVVRPSPPEPAPTAHRGEDGLSETDVVVRYRRAEYWVVLNQFVRAGRGGAWSIITITAM